MTTLLILYIQHATSAVVKQYYAWQMEHQRCIYSVIYCASATEFKVLIYAVEIYTVSSENRKSTKSLAGDRRRNKSTTVVKYVLKRIFDHSLHAIFLKDYDALNLPAGHADRVQHFLQQKRGMLLNRCVRRYFRRTFSHFVDLSDGASPFSQFSKGSSKAEKRGY